MLINRPTTDATRSPLLSAFVFLGNGGSVAIKPRWAITAAHCAPPAHPDRYAEVHRHPSMDLALVRLRERRSDVIPALSPRTPASPGDGCSVLASGFFGSGDVGKGDLRQIVPQQQRIACARNRIESSTSTYHVIGLDDEPDEAAPQMKDSGGALVIHGKDGRPYHAGVIVSGDTGSPARLGAKSYAVRLDVQHVHQWIAMVTGDHDDDGDVDVRDFNIVASRYGEQGFDIATFNQLVSHFGD